MDELVEKIIRFRNARDWEKWHNPDNIAKAIVIEAGELLENFQWSVLHCDYDNSKYNHENAIEEIADIMIYCLLFCEASGIDPEQAILSKIEKNAKKYPVKGNQQ